MVVKLTPPAVDGVALVGAIVAERQNGINAAFFSAIQAEWESKVQEYETHQGSPAHIFAWDVSNTRRATFLNLYSEREPLAVQSAMLRDLRAHELNICPACGEVGRPNTLDHYLPKNAYPHFCVTPLNLFPMCDACQTKKLEKTNDAHTPRFFIHPYFDEFVEEQVLMLFISPPYDAPSYDLVPHPSVDDGDRDLLLVHLNHLAIEKRYGNYFREQYRRLLRLVETLRARGQDVVATLNAFSEATKSPSPNSWEHIFYSGVIGDPILVAYLESGPLPSYL